MEIVAANSYFILEHLFGDNIKTSFCIKFLSTRHICL